MGILADIAPYSREYNRIRAVVDKQSHSDTELRAHYEQIVDQVRQTKESTLQVDQRRFDAPVDKIEGTIKSASFHGIELSEYPGLALLPRTDQVEYSSADGVLSIASSLVSDIVPRLRACPEAETISLVRNSLKGFAKSCGKVG
jgi:hypothetical protein